MDTTQWPQDIVVKPMEEIVVTNAKPSSLERKVRPQKEQALNCPRCNSTNTKFCYYNNYSLSQPRYFCKTCRRYWTEGGSLRNIPVGGGSRKNKRSSSNSVSNPSKKLPDLVPQNRNPNTIKIHDQTQDLNLGFPTSHDFKTITELIQVPNFDQNKDQLLANPSNSSSSNSSHHLSSLELLTGITTTATTTTAASRGLNINSFIPMPIGDGISIPSSVYSSGGLNINMISQLPDQFKPSLNFSLDGLGSNYGAFQGVQETTGNKLLFPFEDLKSGTGNTNDAEHNRDQQGDSTAGYWNGVIGGGSW